MINIEKNKAVRGSRRGLSLLEVVLAIAILGSALAVIGNLVYLGSRSASNARLYSEAQILCDSKMAEIAAGVLPAESTSGSSIEEAPDWVYAVEVFAAEHVGLLTVRVTVQQAPSVTADPTPFTLTRLIPDPNYEPPVSLLQ